MESGSGWERSGTGHGAGGSGDGHTGAGWTERSGESEGSGRSRESYRVKGTRVMEKLRELLREGNVRHVVVKTDRGKKLVEFPVTLGVAGVLLLPLWTAMGAIAAVVGNCSIEVERTEEAEVVPGAGGA